MGTYYRVFNRFSVRLIGSNRRNYARGTRLERFGLHSAKDGKPNVSETKRLLDDSASFAAAEDISDHWATPTYLSSRKPRDQSAYAVRPIGVDPTKTSIILFPGQGTQFVGMGRRLIDVPNVRQMYEVSSDILGFDLLKLCLEGPESTLEKTLYCQPAVVVTSLAAVEKLREDEPQAIESCVATAGFSVGEISALIFAGALTFEDGIRLLKVRAEAMQEASQMAAGGMMSIFFKPGSQISLALEGGKVWGEKCGLSFVECKIASDLFPHCKVIAGNDEALKFIELNAHEFGIYKWKRLSVSGAFHTQLMLPAEEVVREALEELTVKNPVVAVHSNVDGKRYRNAKHVIKQLPKQICRPVRWEQTMHVLYERRQDQGFPRTFECGPGKTLKALLAKVNSKACTNYLNIEV